MKKALILFALLLASAAMFAQNSVISLGGTTGLDNSAESTATKRKTAAYTYIWQVNINAPVLYTYSIRLQDLGGKPLNNTATLVLSGALENSANAYKTITTITLNAKAVPADTILIGGITSSPTTYKYYKWTVTPSDTMWVEHILMNIQPTVK
ncbi:MAG TPA: hypothetical protein PLP69_08185 [Bacteroidales bacterium]|nr:hypothetical protein [Bacteroidales bacterium]